MRTVPLNSRVVTVWEMTRSPGAVGGLGANHAETGADRFRDL